MKKIFVDTNVIIDFLADRRPFSFSAARLFSSALAKEIKIYISAVSYNNIYYILNQSLSHSKTVLLLADIAEFTETVDVTKAIIQHAIKSDFKDFEDAIQYYCALSVNKIEVIITRDPKDFKKSTIPVMSAEEVLNLF